MKGFNKLIKFLDKSWGDDLGRGKNNTAKHRHKHMIMVRLRRFVKDLSD